MRIYSYIMRISSLYIFFIVIYENISSLGNRRFLHAVETDADLPHGILRKRTRLEAEGDEEAGSTSAVVSSDGVVMHNGVFVDINSIMQNLNKSEKSRVSMEARLKELQQDLGKFLLPDATWLINYYYYSCYY